MIHFHLFTVCLRDKQETITHVVFHWDWTGNACHVPKKGNTPCESPESGGERRGIGRQNKQITLRGGGNNAPFRMLAGLGKHRGKNNRGFRFDPAVNQIGHAPGLKAENADLGAAGLGGGHFAVMLAELHLAQHPLEVENAGMAVVEGFCNNDLKVENVNPVIPVDISRGAGAKLPDTKEWYRDGYSADNPYTVLCLHLKSDPFVYSTGRVTRKTGVVKEI